VRKSLQVCSSRFKKGGVSNSVRLGTCPWRVREEREGSTAVQAGAFIVKGNATIG
jgi:hypothetical protein